MARGGTLQGPAAGTKPLLLNFHFKGVSFGFEAQLHYQLLPQGGNIPEPRLPGELRAECQLGPWKVIV